MKVDGSRRKSAVKPEGIANSNIAGNGNSGYDLDLGENIK